MLSLCWRTRELDGGMSGSRRTPALSTALALSLAVVRCAATVLITPGSGQTPTRFDDVPSMDGFGPRIPDEGFVGHLQLAKPNKYACSTLDKPVLVQLSESEQHSVRRGSANEERSRLAEASSTSGQTTRRRENEEDDGGLSAEPLPAAVLISRSIKDAEDACTFEKKAILAQQAGYGLVIVYDSEQGNMFKMRSSTDQDVKHPELTIPLVLVTQASGLALTALINESPDTRGPEVYVDNIDPFVGVFVTVNLTTFMLVSGIMLALLTCGSMMVLTLHRYLRRYEDLVAGTTRPMSLPEVLQLPEVKVEAGSRLEGDSCPVCLEAYTAGDKLRSLPCQHAFHAGCITPWLTERQRTCPMCKDPVSVGQVPRSPSSSAALLEAPATGQDAPTPLPRNEAPGSGSARNGWGSGRASRNGDRLPLLLNSRGASSDGGSIQETSPV